MGEQFDALLNVTVLYPDAPKDILGAVMQGKVHKIVVRIEALPVPQVDSVRYFSEPEYRVEFQRWLNDIWQQKDAQIDLLLAECHPADDYNKLAQKATDSDCPRQNNAGPKPGIVVLKLSISTQALLSHSVRYFSAASSSNSLNT